MKTATGADDKDVTVEFTYTADGNLATLKAKNANTDDQVTTYVYGTSTGGITPEVYRNDLLRAEIYPDSDDPSFSLLHAAHPIGPARSLRS